MPSPETLSEALKRLTEGDPIHALEKRVAKLEIQVERLIKLLGR